MIVMYGSLSARDRQAEVMDQPGLEEGRHLQALRGLARINWLSGSAGILWPAIQKLARDCAGQPLHILDVATGGGDVPIRLWHKAQKVGIPVEITGCDRSPTALAHAECQARHQDAAVRFFRLDVLQDALPDGYDVVTCSLFLHHLEEAEAQEFLSRLAQAARRMVLVNDLRRSAVGYVMAYLGTRLLSASPVVHIDGPLSVRAAFTVEEARALAERAGLVGAAVVRRWPFRFLLTWRRPS